MASAYSRIPVNDAQTRYAPRPHQSLSTLFPPPKMNKDLFDRCGNCTRAFGFLSRKRHCGNCGFVYCSDCCTEKVKLVKFQGLESRDVKVCDYCKEFLKIDRMPSQVLITMSVRSLREYIEAYGIARSIPFVEKTDLINTILNAQITEHNEEIFRQTTPGFRDWYRKHERQTRAQPHSQNPFPSSNSNIDPRPSSRNSNSHDPTHVGQPNLRAGLGSETRRSTDTPDGKSRPQTPLTMPNPFDAAGEAVRQGLSDMADFFKSETIVSPDENPRTIPEQRRDSTARRDSAMFDRRRRPYAGTPEQLPPATRPRSANDLSATMEEIHLTQAPFERQRRRYSSSNPNISTASPSPPPPVVPPSTDLRILVQQGTDFSTLSTSILLSIMRANNCPLPPGAVEKEDLINRVEEMASFIVAAPEETPRVRDEDEDDCKICFERVADYCLVPCGHTGFCFMCARKMTSCPFCKKEVGHAQKLWKV